ncbi:MAG TPA: hypothetical protein VG269_20315 [Tepidisphaeraceae bacterium]|jgi:hypothetical protein|nr:hypothetical protein [Tepidisphaeraceae bacterium]
MKSFIILLLFVALGAAAYFTRPTKDSFRTFIEENTTKDDHNLVSQAIDKAKADYFANDCEIKDRYLWVTVQRQGKTVFTGAFAHWFSHDEVKKQLQQNLDKAKDKAKDGMDAVEQHLEKKV